jgi:membrane protein XagC
MSIAQPLSAPVPARAVASPVLVFLAAALVLGALALWLLTNHYVNEIALQRWAESLALLGAGEQAVKQLGLAYPHVSSYALIPFHFVPGLSGGAAPHLLSVLAAAALMALWYRDASDYGHTRAAIWLGVLMVAAHPLFLWAATSGTQTAVTMLLYYLLYGAARRLRASGDAQALMQVGGLLALLFLVEPLAGFLLLALMPLIVFTTPRSMWQSTPFSLGLLVLLLLPAGIVIGTWIYLNWLFEHAPWAYLQAPRAHLTLAVDNHLHGSWQQSFGSSWLAALGVGTLLAAASFPVAAYVLWHARRLRDWNAVGTLMLVHPLIALAFASVALSLVQPFEILALLLPVLLAELAVRPPRMRAERVLLLGTGLASVLLGWAVFDYRPSAEMQRWSAALSGTAEPAYAGDAALGVWLRGPRAPLLLDERSGVYVIVAHGSARGLILSGSDAFKLDMRRSLPQAPLIAVPEPRSLRGRQDALNLRFPGLYGDGLPGYRRVYDQGGWRVYERE